jgi:hypothetical protein
MHGLAVGFVLTGRIDRARRPTTNRSSSATGNNRLLMPIRLHRAIDLLLALHGNSKQDQGEFLFRFASCI